MFKSRFVFILFVIIPFFLRCETQDEKLKKELIQELEIAKYNLSIKYAPAEWKKHYLGWNPSEFVETIKSQLNKSRTFSGSDWNSKNKGTSLKEYQKIIKRFFNTTLDYHVKPLFFSTESAFFPLKLKKVGSHYYISGLDGTMSLNGDDILFESDEIDEKLFENLVKFEIGDEVLAFDGKPINQLIEEIIDEELGGDRTPTGYALAERMIFVRKGRFGRDVPSGTFEMTLLLQNEETPVKCVLPWIHVKEWVGEAEGEEEPDLNTELVIPGLRKGPSFDSIKKAQKYLQRDFNVHFAEELMRPKKYLRMEEEGEQEEEASDDREKGFLPELGKILWQTEEDKYFYAYIYENEESKKIGYFYLPSFSYFSGLADARMKEFLEILVQFNEETDGLIIDITNNSGGNAMFMYGMLAALTDKPLKIPYHHEILIQEDVYSASVIHQLFTMIKELDQSEVDSMLELFFSGYPNSPKLIDQMISFSKSIMKAWKSGNRMTPPLYVFGIEEIEPHPEIRYTKPLMVLTNELDFSCADFFPAILQDNKRALLFGKRTAGAGGSVREFPHISSFGLQGYALTASIAFRPDGKPIENLGVTPDVPCEITLKDIRENYVDYRNAVNREINRLIR